MNSKWAERAGLEKDYTAQVIAVGDLEVLSLELRERGILDLIVIAQASNCKLITVIYWELVTL